MAIIRESDYDNTAVGLFATAALFCGIACTIIMLRFGRFRASMNISSTNNRQKLETVDTNQVPSKGVYRVYRDDPLYNGAAPIPQKQISQDMVKIPNKMVTSTPKPVSKSTGNLAQTNVTETNVTKSQTDITNNRKPEQNRTKQLTAKELKQLEKDNKKRIAEQRKKDKQFIAKVLKEDRERATREIQLKKEREKNDTKKPGDSKQPQPKKPNQAVQKPNQAVQKPNQAVQKPNQPVQTPNQPVQAPNPANQQPTTSQGYSTNTLESSISRSSGPPPYTERAEVVPSRIDSSGNTSFSKPVNPSSWDMISQHRQQLSRPATGVSRDAVNPRQMNLQYSVGRAPVVATADDNSEA